MRHEASMPGVQRSISGQKQCRGIYVAEQMPRAAFPKAAGGTDGRSFPKINADLVQSLRSGVRIKLSVSHLISASSSLYDPLRGQFSKYQAQGSMSVGSCFCGLNLCCGADLNSTESSVEAAACAERCLSSLRRSAAKIPCSPFIPNAVAHSSTVRVLFFL